jgi:GH25 family lysozyme M1 (1,4-beta-N-acetylmuramidase)
MHFKRSEGAKAVDREFHEFRQRARQTGFNVDQFGDSEIAAYNLETARITGSDNPHSYRINRAIDFLAVNGTDVRELRDR